MFCFGGFFQKKKKLKSKYNTMARDRGEDKQQRNACQIRTRAAALKL